MILPKNGDLVVLTKSSAVSKSGQFAKLPKGAIGLVVDAREYAFWVYIEGKEYILEFDGLEVLQGTRE